jgi:hypothetical protein
METVEVKILQYTFRFRQLTWREETSFKFPKEDDRLRTILSYALAEVSGLKVQTQPDAMKVLKALPASVIQRVFILYKGSFPIPRRFATMGLYKAPEPGKMIQRIQEVEEHRDQILDKVERELGSKFDKQDLRDSLEAERIMLRNSKMRGATKPSPEEDDRLKKDAN